MGIIVGTNSYALRADADSYFDDSLRKEAWKAFTGAKRDQAMIEATRVFERQAWAGEKTVPAQALAFPRTGLIDENGNSITSADSLGVISQAQFEYALALLTEPSLLTSRDATGTNIKKVEAGSAKVTYFRQKNGSRFPLQIMDLIKHFFLGADGSSDITGSFSSGTGDSSSFTDLSSTYGLSRGFS